MRREDERLRPGDCVEVDGPLGPVKFGMRKTWTPLDYAAASPGADVLVKLPQGPVARRGLYLGWVETGGLRSAVIAFGAGPELVMVSASRVKVEEWEDVQADAEEGAPPEGEGGEAAGEAVPPVQDAPLVV